MAADPKYDLIGQVFSELTVKEKIGQSRHRKMQWRCRCVCGRDRLVSSSGLTTGNVLSCSGYRMACQKKDAPTRIQTNRNIRKPIKPKNPEEVTHNYYVDDVLLMKDMKKMIVRGKLGWVTTYLFWARKSGKTGDFYNNMTLEIGRWKKSKDGRYFDHGTLKLDSIGHIRKMVKFLNEYIQEYDDATERRERGLEIQNNLDKIVTFDTMEEDQEVINL